MGEEREEDWSSESTGDTVDRMVAQFGNNNYLDTTWQVGGFKKFFFWGVGGRIRKHLWGGTKLNLFLQKSFYDLKPFGRRCLPLRAFVPPLPPPPKPTIQP